MIIIIEIPLQEKSFKHCKSLLNKKDMKVMMGIRIHSELKKLLQDLADKDGRSLSNYVNKIILSYLKEHESIDWKKPNK
jgi:hypothetical protein